MRHLKAIIGLLLIAAAVLAIIFWESGGREKFTEQAVLVAAGDIEKGQIISREDISVASFDADSVVADAYYPDEGGMVLGKQAKSFIPKNAQISKKLTEEAARVFPAGYSVFRIKSEWIDNRSSSIRKGDRVGIYSGDGSRYLGSFEVAFVKTADEAEVITPEGVFVKNEEDPLARSAGSGILDHIEIICDIEDYKAIKLCAEMPVDEEEDSFKQDISGLLIVQEAGD